MCRRLLLDRVDLDLVEGGSYVPPPVRSLRLDDRRDALLDLALLLVPPRDLERADRELDLKIPSPSPAPRESNSRRDRPEDRSRWRERRATAKAKNVAMKTTKAKVAKTLANNRVQRDSLLLLENDETSSEETVPTV